MKLLLNKTYKMSAAAGIAMIALFAFAGQASAATAPACDSSTFDSASIGTVNGQEGWSVSGASYDQGIVSNTYGFNSFGCQTLRVSNAVTSGGFDWIYAPSIANESGEASSTSDGQSGGTRQNHFEAQFDIAAATSTEQPNLQVSVSPDRGDGARMSYLRFNDRSDGIHVSFNEYVSGNFVESDIATLDRATAHTIKFSMDFIDGPANDVVKIYIDGSLVKTGTSWEDYFRDNQPTILPTVDLLIIQARDNQGGDQPANLGGGFLFDNVSLTSSTIAPDTTPDAFSFTAQTDSALSTVVESNSITVSGINRPAAITVANGEYSVNGGAYATSTGTVVNGDSVKVRQTTSASYHTSTDTTLTIGGVSATFTTTTYSPAVSSGGGGSASGSSATPVVVTTSAPASQTTGQVLGASTFNFTSNLGVGTTGEEVVALQEMLVANGYLVMPAGASYGYFGPITKAAVAKWQAEHQVPATGFWGPISIAKFNALSGAGPTVSADTQVQINSLKAQAAIIQQMIQLMQTH